MNGKSVTIDGNEITREQFELAKAAGIARWELYSNNEQPDGGCEFCEIFSYGGIRNCLTGKVRTDCPVWDEKVPPSQCCTEWVLWQDEPQSRRCHSDGNPEAKAVLARIKSLDWDEWAAKYNTEQMEEPL